MVEKMQTLSFINTDLSAVTAAGSQVKAAWTVLPSHKLARECCWPCLRTGLGGISSPSLPSREKRFLELLGARGPGCACSRSPATLRAGLSILVLHHPKASAVPVLPGQCGSVLSLSGCRSRAGSSCASQRHGHYQGSCLSCGFCSISWDSPVCMLGMETSSSNPVFIFQVCFQLLSFSPPHAVSES